MKAVILAAGKGTRMHSELPKMLHTVLGKPMLLYAVGLAKKMQAEEIIVVVGYKGDLVAKELSGCTVVFQEQQLGTAHAVMMAQTKLSGFEGDILILYGDVPCLRLETIKHMEAVHAKEKAAITILSAVFKNPAGYGRIIRSNTGQILAIKESKDCNNAEADIREINSGIYIIQNAFLQPALHKISNNNEQGEYYLTDIVKIAVEHKDKIASVTISDETEIIGINTPQQLKEVEGVLKSR